jgi:mono/diheme cytochrome c family protein
VNTQERHYNINKLNVIFACAALVLLSALSLLLLKDYSRPWKEYQKDFRGLEIEKTRVKYDSVLKKLEADPEYQEVAARFDQVKKDYQSNCAGRSGDNKDIEKLKAENEILLQKQRFTKAKLDAARYRYESQQAHGGDHGENGKKEFDELTRNVKELDLAVEQSTRDLNEKTKVVENCGVQLKEVERQKRVLTAKAQVLESKLTKIDPGRMTFVNRIAEMVRDLPIIDLANPNYKIQQIVLKDITEDVNFVKVPKVDRCVTCHLGIANPDYVEAPQPFKTHPRLEIFLGRESPHPVEEFACTVCHGGRGRGTDFISSAHTPSLPEQAKEWEEKYGWEPLRHWDRPMLPQQYTQASCLKCHSGQTSVKNADKLNLGLNIIEKAGCYSCHTVEKYKGWPKPGPDLTKIASKVSRDWAYRWISSPQSFRHDTWMPAFFGQSNNSDPVSVSRAQQEIHAMVDYLFQNAEDFKKDEIPLPGDVKRGEELVASVGCLGCHSVKPDAAGSVTVDSLRKEHGPNLMGEGTKASKKWIYNWIKTPNHYSPETTMPNLRLTDQEASDIAEYLAGLENKEFNLPIPAKDEKVLDRIVFEFLVKGKTHKEAQEQVASMNSVEKSQFAGKKLIRQYGCFSCHDIAGFETEKPIGAELSEEGDKSIHNLDFGLLHLDHTNYAWFARKLKDPRIFDQGRVKAPDEKLRMPNFYFTDEEVDAVVTVLLGLVKEKPEAKIVPRTPRNLILEDGQRLVRQLNCRGCHAIEGEGGTIQAAVKDWLVTYDNRSEPEAGAIVKSFSPPDLTGEGKKVQTQWLFDFLHSPTAVRPWLKTRMPTYHLDPVELNALIKYFSALDNEVFPFEEKTDVSLMIHEFEAAKKLFSDDYFGCAKCHIVGDKLPGGSPDSWAPNFALSKGRLKPDWIIGWIKDPQGLLPGTKMPNYFDANAFDASGPDDILGGDEHEQIRVLRNYLMTLSEIPGKKEENKPLGLPTAPPAAEVSHQPTLAVGTAK